MRSMTFSSLATSPLLCITERTHEESLTVTQEFVISRRTAKSRTSRQQRCEHHHHNLSGCNIFLLPILLLCKLHYKKRLHVFSCTIFLLPILLLWKLHYKKRLYVFSFTTFLLPFCYFGNFITKNAFMFLVVLYFCYPFFLLWKLHYKIAFMFLVVPYFCYPFCYFGNFITKNAFMFLVVLYFCYPFFTLEISLQTAPVPFYLSYFNCISTFESSQDNLNYTSIPGLFPQILFIFICCLLIKTIALVSLFVVSGKYLDKAPLYKNSPLAV